MIRLILLSTMAFAEEAHHTAAGAHEAHGIPWSSIGIQAFNFGFLVLVLFMLLRKTISSHFQSRAREYNQLVERAEDARRLAEKSHREIKERLSKLEVSAEEGIANAKSEAEELKGRMISEAKALSVKLEQEAQRTVAVEVEKARAQLRQELLGQALEASRASLKTSLSSTEQKKLQNEFVEKIQVVGG